MGLTNNLGKLSNMITSTGSAVGIAQASPAFTLDVSGTLRNTTSAYFATASGNVGIGTTTATNKLTITNDGNAANALRINDTNANASFLSLSASNTDAAIIANGTAAIPLDIYTGGSARVRVSATGNVGIGTSTITAWNGNAGTVVSQYSAGNNNTIYSAQSNCTSIDTGAIFEGFSNNTTSGSKALGSIVFLRENTSTTALSSYTGFYTNNAGTVAERMRITSGGQVQISQAGYTFSYGLKILNWGFVEGGDAKLYVGYSGSGVGNFNNSTGVYTATSDINKKKDFEESTIGLNAVLGLKPTLYRMKTDEETSDKHLGFIAQEVKDFIPQAYSESINGEDTFIGLTEMPIIAALTKAIQEQQIQIQNLQEQNQNLKSRLDKAGL